jgi:hypothetical protein
MRSLIAVAAVLAATPASADPSDTRLVVTGIALAPPTYVLGVTTHEGSHALAAKLVGADVDELHLFPPGIDPHSHTFRFGWTYVHGLTTRGDRLLFYIAPKLTDLVLLGGFAGLVYTSAWPSNRYGSLVLTVLATGWWVDFSKDVVLFSSTNDVTRFESVACLTGWRRAVARVVYAGVVVGAGIVVAHGYERTFSRDDATVVPMLATSF